MLRTSAFSLSSRQWNEVLQDLGASPHLLPFLLEGLYRNRSIWEKHVSSKTISFLLSKWDFSLPDISSSQEADDGTVKFLMKLRDGMEVETVLIPFHKRFTVCLSTQVGCGMNCSFCYTGTQGLKRNLTAGEIVGQYLKAREWLWNKNPQALGPSIVFMGQGEPLHNGDEVGRAIEVLTDPNLIGVGHRQITLSTVGFLPGLQKLKEFPRINVALSLHSPFQQERSLLIPVNEKYSLSEVLSSLDELPLLPRQFITYEYLLIKNLNMSEDHVEALSKILGHRKALINLIPFNPFPGTSWERPSEDEILSFKEKLVEKKLRVMIRTTKGSEILAACGQLKVNRLSRNNGRN
jgi:23S rRNA (adenine2503-C2)-methyltransferase